MIAVGKLSISLPLALIDKLRKEAEQDSRSVSTIIRLSLETRYKTKRK